ncbi:MULTISPECIES: Tautomerase enzyme [unclassified Burkholderia]|uniref:Tautomerase enzyme n=1 Tax=unclassified Burkholderia TaxID=2613784 RepID=UPI000F56CF88|nr:MULTISPECIES: Tautomerase enzyme [unclassified Burkholderia]RQR88830.1 Tautomerase enzyme [Burkholderia sp. Bp9011]RQR97992.1 Tautomerase enzyme [Burkholderia sp. Bp9010]RQS12640.1 Tautomerase enzyme [Burkholderia sp. Bp8991]RQS81391.1 Tautomerase enzyme [Burkholderia sp. Bp8977]
MPMIDAMWPDHALTPDAEARLVRELTDILIEAEGYDPASPVVQRVTVFHLHRPAAIYIGGERTDTVRYRIIPSVPEVQYTDESRRSLVRRVTEAVARAEGRPFDDVAPRVWIFPTEIPDGAWGTRGAIWTLPDIHALLAGEPERDAGAERLARRRRDKARVALAAALDAANASVTRNACKE